MLLIFSASKYFIHYSEDFEELLLNRKSTERLNDGHIVQGNLSQPRPSGFSEKLHLSLNTTGLDNNMTLFLSIYAVDSSGNEGDSSNIISLSPAYDTSVPRAPVPDIASVQTYLAIMLPLCLAIIAFLIFIVIFLVLKSKKIKSENIEQTEECTTHSVCSLDLEHMNYMFEGEYRKRLPEDIDSWSRGSI